MIRVMLVDDTVDNAGVKCFAAQSFTSFAASRRKHFRVLADLTTPSQH